MLTAPIVPCLGCSDPCRPVECRRGYEAHRTAPHGRQRAPQAAAGRARRHRGAACIPGGGSRRCPPAGPRRRDAARRSRSPRRPQACRRPRPPARCAGPVHLRTAPRAGRPARSHGRRAHQLRIPVPTASDQATRVVIAEDEAIIRLDLKELLEEEGYEVVGETGRGDEAVELVRNLGPDLAILDIKMPGMDGLTAASEITADRQAAVLILTAFSQRDLIERARDAGALAYLVKPFQKSELIPAVEVALGRFAEMKALAEENSSLADQLATRKLVDRAKGILMDKHGMAESDAFRFVQKSAMDGRRKLGEVAQ